MTFRPRGPYGRAPLSYHIVALVAGRRRQHVGNGDGPAVARRRESGPFPSLLGELHMRALHVLAGTVLFNGQIEPDEGESDRNGLAAFVRELRGISVHDVLMNE